MKKIMPFPFLLVGLFFLLLPFIGSSSEPQNVDDADNHKAAGVVSIIFGAFMTLLAVYYIYKAFCVKKP